MDASVGTKLAADDIIARIQADMESVIELIRRPCLGRSDAEPAPADAVRPRQPEPAPARD